MKIKLAVLLWLLTLSAIGQNFNEYGNATDVFYRNYSLINPAASGTNSPAEIYLSYRGLTGVFSQVRSFYASANFRIAEKKNKYTSHNKQVLGALFYGDKEGDFFSKSRTYINYAFHIGLNKNLYLSAGLSAGLVSYAYKSSTASSGGSTNGFTGNLGLWLYNKRMHLGVSSLDINNQILKPIVDPIILSRFYTLTFDYSFVLSHYINLVPQTEIIYYGNQYNRINAGAYLLIQNNVSVGFLYKLYQGYIFTAGFENISLFQGKTNFFFSYKMPSADANQLPVSAIEITMNYLFGIKKPIISEEKITNDIE